MEWYHVVVTVIVVFYAGYIEKKVNALESDVRELKGRANKVSKKLWPTESDE